MWMISFGCILYHYYYYLFYSSLIPYETFQARLQDEDLKQEYFRVLKSIVVRQLLCEYVNKDISDIIVFYHDNMLPVNHDKV